MILRSLDLLDAGRVDEAIDDVNQAIENITDDEQKAGAYIHRGDIHAGVGEWKHALIDYGMARMTSSHAPQPYLRRGLMQAYAGDLDGALEDLKQAYEYEPWDPGVLSHFGAVRALRGEFQDALELLNRSIEGNNDDPETHLWRGLVSVYQGSSPVFGGPGRAEPFPGVPFQVLEEFRHVRRLDLTFPSASSIIGITQAWKGDLDAAILALRAAIKEDPRDARADALRRGRWLVRVNGTRPWSSSTRRSTSTAVTLTRLALRGAVLALKGKGEEAVRAVDRAVEPRLSERSGRRAPRGRARPTRTAPRGGQRARPVDQAWWTGLLDRRHARSHPLPAAMQARPRKTTSKLENS